MNGFTYFNSYHKALRNLPDEIRLALHDAIDDYMFENIEPKFTDSVAVAMFELIRPHLNKSKKRGQAGESNDNQNEIKTESNEIKCESNDNQNEIIAFKKENKKENKEKKEKENNKSISNEIDSPLPDEQRAIDLWNGLQDVGLKPIVRLTDKRKRLLRSRLRQYGISEFEKAIVRIRGSDFLCGKNRQGWMACFDWFILPNNFAKVLEGNYDNKTSWRDEVI